MDIQIKEKRRYLRLKKRIPLHLKDEQFDAIAYTTNISQRGALCQLNYQIPLMSKLQIKLLLPSPEDNKTASNQIICQGVVVRSQPVVKDNSAFYDTAIFFTKLSRANEKKIAHYVERDVLTQEPDTASDIQLN